MSAGPNEPSTQPTILVADSKPLSLLATAGVLHHEGMRCICARDHNAVRKAFGLVESDPAIQSSAALAPPRIDEPHGRPSHGRPGQSGASAATTLNGQTIDLLLWDVGDDAPGVLQMIDTIRSAAALRDLPVILIAESRWAGLEKKTEAMAAPTHCLFKPIDPRSLITITQQLLWMPSLQAAHRQRGSRPTRPGWVTL